MEREYSRTFADLGFIKGRSNPCIFRHREKDCVIFIHGDDIVVSGSEEHLEEIRRAICDKYITKVRGIVGPEERDDK